jgi:hypothetical protein
VVFVAWVLTLVSATTGQEAAAYPHRHIAAVIAPAESAIVGTIERFEAGAHQLVLQTKDAHVPFIVAADAVVRMGSRTLPLGDLATHRGRRAKVRYNTQADGRRTAHWIVISSEPPHKTP